MDRAPRYFLSLVPAVMLVAAIADWPYGYYTFLRLVVTVCAGVLAYIEYNRVHKTTVWVLVLGTMALLFNPIVPVHLNREVWAVVDLVCAGLFVSVAAKDHFGDSQKL